MSQRPIFLAILAASTMLVAGCAGVTGGLSSSSTASSASRADDMLAHPPGSGVTPTGVTREFNIYLNKMTHELYPGASMAMWGMSFTPEPSSASIPGPTIRVTEGDTVLIHFFPLVGGFNHTLHFHGQNVPNDMDGVPFQTQKPVEPNEGFDYQFIAKPAGTYWYHCHVDAQHHIDMGMYGVMIVDPQNKADDPQFDKEFVLQLDDMDRFHVEGGQPATDNLPQSGDPFQYEEYVERSVSDQLNRNPAVADKITGTPLRPTREWTPVTYAPYTANYNTFLINGHAFPSTGSIVVTEGDIIRLRTVNVGNTMMSLHLHGHHMLVTHKDGVRLDSPYWVDTVMIGPAERYDLYVKMDNPGVWDLHDHFGGHTQNDNIFPGGAMMMLCYDTMAGCEDMGGMNHGGMKMRSGDLVQWRWNALADSLP